MYKCPYLGTVYGYSHAELKCNKCSVYSEWPTALFVMEEVPFQNVISEPTKGVAMEHKTKTKWTGEGQQKFPLLDKNHTCCKTALLRVVTERLTPLPVKEVPFQTIYTSKEEEKYGHGFKQGQKPRTTLLVMDSSSKLSLVISCQGQTPLGTEAVWGILNVKSTYQAENSG
jgi:hypothetical protein